MSTNAASIEGSTFCTRPVDIADERRLLAARDVVLDEHVVLEHGDLDASVLGADDHVAVDGLAAGKELRLGHDRASAAYLAAVAAALLLRFETRRTLDPLGLRDELDRTLARLTAAAFPSLQAIGAGCLVSLAVRRAPAAATTSARTGSTGRTLIVAVVVLRARRQSDDLRRVEEELRGHLRDELHAAEENRAIRR